MELGLQQVIVLGELTSTRTLDIYIVTVTDTILHTNC